MTIVNHRNPACGTSRNLLEIIRASWVEPVVIDYLSVEWTRPQYLALLDAMLAHRVTVNRPIVCSPKGVQLCRPFDRLLDLLYRMPPGLFYNEAEGMIPDKKRARVD